MERELIEQEIVDLIARGMHQRFSELITQLVDLDPYLVAKWVTLSETPFDELGAIEQVVYLKMAMVELQKLRPLLPAYVNAFAPQENPTL